MGQKTIFICDKCEKLSEETHVHSCDVILRNTTATPGLTWNGELCTSCYTKLLTTVKDMIGERA
jgi:hypothetical protein